MRWMVAMLGLIGLTACGADGDPIHPTRDAMISLTDTGAAARAQIGAVQGPVRVSLGLGL